MHKLMTHEELDCLTGGKAKELTSIRSKYSKLASEAKEILESLTVKDKHGKILEQGHSLVYKVQEKARSGKDIHEAVEVIGKDKWLRLQEIWKTLQSLEAEEQKIIKSC